MYDITSKCPYFYDGSCRMPCKTICGITLKSYSRRSDKHRYKCCINCASLSYRCGCAYLREACGWIKQE